MASARLDVVIEPIRFPEPRRAGLYPDRFSFTGSCTDHSRSTRCPVIVEWRTDADGARGNFDSEMA